MTSAIRGFRKQGGQMLAGVMVLLAIVFLLGTAMALSVSTSLHQVDQGAAQDAARYGAESAVARGQAAVEAGPAPTADGCPAPASSVGSLDGQTLLAWPCYITKVDAGPASVRYSYHAETLLTGPAQCPQVPLNGGNGDPTGEARAWSTIAWRSTTDVPAKLEAIVVDEESGCALTDGDGDPTIACPLGSSPAYVYCAFDMNPDKKYWLKLINQGGPASVSAFVVRDAMSGHDCVATVIGKSDAATAEGDLILPEVPASNPATCGLAGASLGLRNRLLP